jgi:hypothetical protein
MDKPKWRKQFRANSLKKSGLSATFMRRPFVFRHWGIGRSISAAAPFLDADHHP